MKKTLCFFLTVLFLLFSAFCESDNWTCPSCGTSSSGNFCSNCGTKKPEVKNDGWTCPSCGTISNGNFCSSCGAKKPENNSDADGIAFENIPVTIHIDFDENAMFSTYAVEMYIDDTFIVKMDHGKNYDGELEVAPGEHNVLFCKAGSTKVTGTCSFEITEPSAFSCNIHANNDKVTISKVKLVASEGPTVIEVNGRTELDLTIDFRRNAAFSTYDVDLFCDDVFITTMPHGEGFHGVLLVSEGIHTLKFNEHGNSSKNGKAEFSVNGKTSFSCHIEATRNGVIISDKRLNDSDSNNLVNKSDYIKACETVQYEKVERNPENYKGKRIKVSGTVIQVIEGDSGSVTMRVSDANGDIWYITYKRADAESRILEDDRITIYGECRGTVSYTTIFGGSVTIPGINALFIDIK